MEEFKPNLETKLDIKKMGTLVQLSGTIRLEGGGESGPTNDGEKDRKTFGSNNGLISFVTEGGVQYVTKFSTEKMNSLAMAGYKNTSLGVPFSNGEKPISGGSDYDKWYRMMNEK